MRSSSPVLSPRKTIAIDKTMDIQGPHGHDECQSVKVLVDADNDKLENGILDKPLTDLESVSGKNSNEIDNFSTKSLQSFKFVQPPKFVQMHLDKQKKRNQRQIGEQAEADLD